MDNTRVQLLRDNREEYLVHVCVQFYIDAQYIVVQKQTNHVQFVKFEIKTKIKKEKEAEWATTVRKE